MLKIFQRIKIFIDFNITPKSLVWIDFGLPHISVQTKLKYLHVYQ